MEHVIFNEEYARAGGPGRLSHISEGLLGPTIIAFGTEAQQTDVLPGILAGDTAAAWAEADAIVGGDLGCLIQIEGRLRRRGDETTRVLHVAEVLAGGGHS